MLVVSERNVCETNPTSVPSGDLRGVIRHI